MRATCPNNKNHDRFITVAKVLESWVVTPEGKFVHLYLGAKDLLQGPSLKNVWECKTCGAQAIVEE